ncbi:ABC transporter substrate-binding protein [Halalkalibacter alkaliphilus]|uniref:ABC transporter substrate-binding protein n=1 Tax=Halalkalibacter alkaliphilus TaxID=2917993 RepID=A0A9X2CQH4_9BACI|nr:ABC transporter substrate-binding protein [Halalkalibacter alkaliphilus]MCL7745766.1 ABC transporter substrate-binding protein [Halalkalibacter alkaliphilus]
MKKLLSSMFLAILATSLVACGGESSSSESSGGTSESSDQAGNSEIVVGWSQMENNNPWRIAETESIRNEAKERGFGMVYTDAQGDTARQVSDIEDMIAQGVNYIILAPREFEGLGPALKSAKEAEIPVILVDRLAKGEAGEDFVTFIGSDFVLQGQRAAEWLVEEMDGKGKIVELTGTTGSSVAIDRKEGFENYINENAPEMEIIASQTGDFARAEGQRVMENMLQSHSGEIDAVYAHNDEMAIGAINAIKSAGLTPGEDIIVVSVDGTKDALQAIINGDMGATVESSPFFGPVVFDVIEQLIAGESVDTEIILEDRFFDSNNATEFVDEAY